MTIPYYVNEHQCDMRAIKPGWYGMEINGKLSSGRFQTGRYASQELFRRGAICEHRPGLRSPLSVPSVETSTSGRAPA